MVSSSLLGGFMSLLLLAGVSNAAPTCNTPSNRACWDATHTIQTDYENSVPITGIVRPYTFTITEVDNWIGPDGRVKEKAMLINNQFPGPTIFADWGDTIQVTVINHLRDNGTSIHWHGIRQLNNSIADGANGVTECPIPPQKQKTYTFLAEQYGTTWYHSHFATQYANGVIGSIQIAGPASLPYEVDLGVFPIGDYYLRSADRVQLELNALPVKGPPPSDNVLFNGTNINPAGPGGKYANVTLTPGLRHRLRLINPSTENNFVVSMVDHQFTVIATDLVPVNSFTTSQIFLGVGQRYDVTIDASKPVGNYWFNVTFGGGGACGNSSNPFPAAIFRYAGAPNALPTKTGTPPTDANCADFTNYTPVVTRTVPVSSFVPATNNLQININVLPDENGVQSVFWQVNNSAIRVHWDAPILEYVRNGTANFPANENLITVNNNGWSFWLIQNNFFVPHPMHLHGHDFVILGTGAGTFNAAAQASLKSSNPTRRDVTMVQSQGWLVVAFKTDNPGAWLFHCHIAWHVSQGLSVQYLERRSEIGAAMDLNSIEPNCQNWRAYYPNDPFKQYDSGI